MFELKPLHTDAIASALTKAERYRLLNEAEEAESICHDVLAVEPDHFPLHPPRADPVLDPHHRPHRHRQIAHKHDHPAQRRHPPDDAQRLRPRKSLKL